MSLTLERLVLDRASDGLVSSAADRTAQQDRQMPGAIRPQAESDLSVQACRPSMMKLSRWETPYRKLVLGYAETRFTTTAWLIL
jgi:hypothetical protein